MTVSKKDNQWLVDIRPDGSSGKRIRKKFSTKAEALRFEAHIISQATAGKEWNPSLKDDRRLSDLIKIWKDEHGKTLGSGDKYGSKLNHFCNDIGNPIARTITAQTISKWRSERLEKIQPLTSNREIQNIKSLFNWLSDRGYISYPNPAGPIKAIKVHEVERPFLSKSQISELYKALDDCPDPDIAIIARICIETGARWGEAQNLTEERVRADRLIFTMTKSKKTRAVPITKELSELILKNRSGQLFRNCEMAARFWLNETLDLPKGISTHILRHSFASHFVMAGGNILTLQKILGHSKIEMTMRYAHLSPDHLEDAVKLNPKNQMDNNWTLQQA